MGKNLLIEVHDKEDADDDDTRHDLHLMQNRERRAVVQKSEIEEEYSKYIEKLIEVNGITTNPKNKGSILNKGINYTTTTSICIELQIFLTKILFNFDLYNYESIKQKSGTYHNGRCS